jgi:hypothetical protein
MSRRVLLGAVAIGYAAFGASLRTLTWQATAAVLLPATIIAVAAIRRPQARAEPIQAAEARAAQVWAVLLAAGLLWEAWAFFNQPGVTIASYGHPSLSSLVGPFLHEWPVRFGAWLVWLYAGWRLVPR